MGGAGADPGTRLIADGVQTFLISDKRSGETLDSFALMSGDALSYDIRAEMALLREELDMLKRAFRRTLSGNDRRFLLPSCR